VAVRGLSALVHSAEGTPMRKREAGRSKASGGRIGRLARFGGLLLALLLIGGGVVPVHASVEPPPAIPHEFAGSVFVDGVPAPEGTLVEAFVDGEEDASTNADEDSRYMLLVRGPGTTVTFRVGGVPANESATWESGKIDDDFNLTVGEAPTIFSLSIASTAGGSVTDPGEGEFAYVKGTVVSLVAEASEGYRFVNWTGNVSAVSEHNAASTTITMNSDYSIIASFAAAPGPDPVPDPFPFPFPCFIATAAYGTPAAEQIGVLREFRDVVLLQSPPGSRFVALYYQLSPPVAQVMAGSSFLTALLRDFLVDPAVRLVEYTGGIWRP